MEIISTINGNNFNNGNPWNGNNGYCNGYYPSPGSYQNPYLLHLDPPNQIPIRSPIRVIHPDRQPNRNQYPANKNRGNGNRGNDNRGNRGDNNVGIGATTIAGIRVTVEII